MMKKILLVFVFFIGSFGDSFCQMHDNVWTLGYSCIPGDSSRFGGTNIYFDVSIPSSKYFCRDINFSRNLSSSISDDEGNLLMMFNGCNLVDAEDNIIEGSENLVLIDTSVEETSWCVNGYNTPHGAMFLPDAYDESTYYLIYRDLVQIDEQPYVISDSLYMATISLDEEGPFVTKKQSILSDTVSIVGVSAVKHANGKDWWVITKDRYTNVYHKHIIDESGVRLHHSQMIGTVDYAINGGNTTRFSPDGSYFVTMYPFGNLDVFTFDRESGNFEEYISIPYWAIPENSLVIDTEFSPSGRYLYIAEIDTLWQFDMQKPKEEFFESKTTVGVYDGFLDPFPTGFWLMQAAPDGKIYMSARNSSKFLHVIHNPNAKGLACDFRQHDFELSTVNSFALPYFPNFRLGPDSTYVDTQEIISAEDSFIIFPNPASDYIEVKSSQVFDELRIYDVNGNIVKISDTDIVKIDDLLSGIYFVKAYNNNLFSASSKFVVGR